MALINLFNLLPVVPLDGGRVVKSITCSIGSRTGLAAVIAGMLLGAVLAVTADLWIFVIVIPLGLLDYLHDRHQAKQAERRAGRHARTAEAGNAPAVRASWDEPVRREPPEDSKHGNQGDAGQSGARIPAGKPPLSPRASQAA